jgi:hypothetical protein
VINASLTLLELRRKLGDLDGELSDWQTAAATGPLRRHYTQIDAVTGTLSEASAKLAAEFSGENPGAWIVERAGAFDRRILDLHRLWGFFRGKLALRFVPWLEQGMMAADDLAWACYEPAQHLIATDMRREPPLVYFSGGSSPVLLPRGTPYVVEPLPDGGLREPEFAEAVRTVPVALIGLPWLQINHLPDAPLVAHEVGHAVEYDLGIGSRVQKLVADAVPESRRSAWRCWAAEAFADVYGVLGCGSGFARALAARLAGHPREIAGEARREPAWGSYPPRTSRVLLAQAALAELEIDTGDPTIAATWLDAYPQRPLREFEEDAAAVAAALIKGPYRDGEISELTTILPYTSRDEEHAYRDARLLLDGVEPDAGGVRHLMAAARIAYDCDAERYAKRRAPAIVLGKVAAIPFDGVRAAGGAEAPSEEVRAARDRRAGRDLSALISRGSTRADTTGGEDVPA